jgi:hypothetical protein
LLTFDRDFEKIENLDRICLEESAEDRGR